MTRTINKPNNNNNNRKKRKGKSNKNTRNRKQQGCSELSVPMYNESDNHADKPIQNKFPSISRFIHCNKAYANLFRQVVNTQFPAPINTTNRRIAVGAMYAEALSIGNSLNNASVFQKVYILCGNLRVPVWQSNYNADNVPIAGDGTLAAPPALFLTPSWCEDGPLYGLLVSNTKKAVLSNYLAGAKQHAWLLTFHNATFPNVNIFFVADGPVTLTLLFYDIAEILFATLVIPAGDNVNFNWGSGTNVQCHMVARVSGTNGPAVGKIFINGDGASYIRTCTSTDPGYPTKFALNFEEEPYSSTVLELSAETRLVRTIGVITNAQQLNILGGSVIQAFIYGNVPFSTNWETYMFQSPTARSANLVKGADLFWFAQDNAGYKWSDNWLPNPFQDPSETPCMSYLTCPNGGSNTANFNVKFYSWAEFCTMNPSIPAQYVLDTSQDWLTATSALASNFRFSANVDHRVVLQYVGSAAAWMVSGAPEAVALRNAMKFAASTALSLGISMIN